MCRLIPAALAALSLLAGACAPYTQTTSGADYLARYDAQAARAAKGSPTEIDAGVRQAAAVEPILTFPARFGLARIENGRLSAVPPSEAALWQKLAERRQALGQFVPIEPLIAAFTAHGQGTSGARYGDVGAIVETIRLGAARQHVDAVLIYEVGARASKDNTFLAVADLTIIGGAILPTREIEAAGLARALLLDVRNGYPYGTASAVTDLSTYSTSWGSDARRDDLREQAMTEVAAKLVPEVDQMLGDLVTEMAARP